MVTLIRYSLLSCAIVDQREICQDSRRELRELVTRKPKRRELREWKVEKASYREAVCSFPTACKASSTSLLALLSCDSFSMGKFHRAGLDVAGPMQFCSSGGGFI